MGLGVIGDRDMQNLGADKGHRGDRHGNIVLGFTQSTGTVANQEKVLLIGATASFRW